MVISIYQRLETQFDYICKFRCIYKHKLIQSGYILFLKKYIKRNMEILIYQRLETQFD